MTALMILTSIASGTITLVFTIGFFFEWTDKNPDEIFIKKAKKALMISLPIFILAIPITSAITTSEHKCKCPEPKCEQQDSDDDF